MDWRRFYGGHYRMVPNGVALPEGGVGARHREPGDPLRIVFVGQAVERKGLRSWCALEALRSRCSRADDRRPSAEEIEPLPSTAPA